ncbi:MAG: hypothetical protein V5804_07250 [Mucilaginibacter sp.]|uniref:hypothetical protein n=1 Tax=Mucilaginibacter sp. TaxID=1882438 RepID=UPI0034E38829
MKLSKKLLLWLHHVNWNYQTKSIQKLWDELCYHYYAGTQSVKAMPETWSRMRPYVDKERFEKVNARLKEQEKEARIWRNASLLYFQPFQICLFPKGLKSPIRTWNTIKI